MRWSTASAATREHISVLHRLPRWASHRDSPWLASARKAYRRILRSSVACEGRRASVAVARRLALARLVSLSGGAAAYIALVAAIYSQTGSALWISAAIFSSVVASVVSAPIAGWIGDRFERRAVLIATDVAAAVVSVAMAATADYAVALVVMLGLSAVAQAPFEPASAAALP